MVGRRSVSVATVGRRGNSAKIAPSLPTQPLPAQSGVPAGWQWPWEVRKDRDGSALGTSLSYIAFGRHDFVPEEDGELAFRKEERLFVIARAPSTHPKGWLVAKNVKGAQGLVPEAYLKPPARNLKKPTVEALAKSVAEIHQDLRQWDPKTELDVNQAAVFADELRKLAEWLSPKPPPPPPPPPPP